MTKGILTVVDGVVTMIQPKLDADVIPPDELLYRTLEKIGRFGWKLEGEVPRVFEKGKEYTIGVVKD